MKRTLLLFSLIGVSLTAFSLPPHPIERTTAPPFQLIPASSPSQVPSINSPDNSDGSRTVDSDHHEPPKIIWDLSDPEIKAAYKAWTLAFMNREAEKLAEHKKAFANSGSMSVVIFWAAQVLLAWAIVAASIEFIRAQRVRTAAAEIQELRVSLEGLALKTSLHGTLLLVIAMSFYYLFLKFVYPITVIGV